MHKGYIISIVLLAALIVSNFGWYYYLGTQKGTTTQVKSMKLATDFLFSGGHSVLFTAVDKGWYLENGISLELLPGYGSGDTCRRVDSGDVDFGIADAGAVVTAISQGLKITALFPYHHILTTNVESKPSNPVNKPKDLEGKKYGVVLGETGDVMLKAWAKLYNLDMSKITVVYMDWGVKVSSLGSGVVDAIPRELYDVDEDSNVVGVNLVAIYFKDFGLDVYGDMFIVRNDIIQNEPELVRGFVNATVHGVKYAVEHQQEAIDILLKYRSELDKAGELLRLQQSASSLYPDVAKQYGIDYSIPDKMQKTWSTYIDALSITSFPIEKLYTNQFSTGYGKS